MGLNTTHGCWCGSYHSFSDFRRAIAAACGIDLDAMDGFGGEASWPDLPPDPIHALLNHSDCDGEIAVDDLIPLAERLDGLVTVLRRSRAEDWIVDRTVQFASGCRRAARNGEPVSFG